MYVFRTHSRLLPDECIAYLVEEVKRKELPGVPRESSPKLKAFFPLTNEGVSVDTVRHNLNILVHIREGPDTDDRQAQIFLPTIVWFEAAGFTKTNLQDMLASPDGESDEARLKRDQAHLRRLQENQNAMQEVYSKANFTKRLVFDPLPVYTDVRFVSDRDRIELFLCNDESKSTTASWLSMLMLRYL